MQYIVAAANLHAFNYGLRGETDPALFKKVVASMVIPKFEPKSGVKIQITETEPVSQGDGGGSYLDSSVDPENNTCYFLRRF